MYVPKLPQPVSSVPAEVEMFDKVIGSVSLCFALFSAAPGVAMAVYYRRLAATSSRNLLELAIIPLAVQVVHDRAVPPAQARHGLAYHPKVEHPNR
jgi:hypothetical protein